MKNLVLLVVGDEKEREEIFVNNKFINGFIIVK